MSLKTPWKKYIGLVSILFLFPLIWVMLFGVFGDHHFNTLPYYAPEGQDSTSYVLPPFAFTNQEGEVYTSDSLKGKVWIAAFYSLNSPYIPKITERLLNINWKYRDEGDIAIVVFSTQSSFDTTQITRPYIDQNSRYNKFPGKWQFLTGNDSTIQDYIRNGFMVEDLSSEAIFRLVDEQGHIRGLYGNTEYHMRNAMEDIALLKKEIDKRAYNQKHEKE